MADITIWSKARDRKVVRSRKEFISGIKRIYGNYRFSSYDTTTVCNPSSVNSFFGDGCVFQRYRELSQMDELAFLLCRNNVKKSYPEEQIYLSRHMINTFDISRLIDEKYRRCSMPALLLFAGFLTIVEASESGIEARIPNKEAADMLKQELGDDIPDPLKNAIARDFP